MATLKKAYYSTTQLYTHNSRNLKTTLAIAYRHLHRKSVDSKCPISWGQLAQLVNTCFVKFSLLRDRGLNLAECQYFLYMINCSH